MSTPETQLARLGPKIATVRDLFEKNKQQLALALPKHMSPDRLLRVAMTSINTTPKLIECTPRSLLGAVMQCAQLGLEPGILGHAYLVPFRNSRAGTYEVQLIPGYRGLIALARRSGDVSTIQAHAVRVGDAFRYSYGLNPVLEHVPSDDANRHKREVTHFYAIGRLKDGGVQFEVMTRAEVDAHRDRYSRAANDGPWKTNYEEMGCKTALRRLCKLLPASIELHTAVGLSETAELQLPQDLGSFVPGEDESETAPQGGKLDQLTESLRETQQAELPA